MVNEVMRAPPTGSCRRKRRRSEILCTWRGERGEIEARKLTASWGGSLGIAEMVRVTEKVRYQESGAALKWYVGGRRRVNFCLSNVKRSGGTSKGLAQYV